LLKSFQRYVACHLHARKLRQILANLTPGPSFGHNLRQKCPNGSYELTSDIYILRNFKCYKECFNPMVFGPCNLSKDFGIHQDSNSQIGSSLGSVEVQSLPLSHIPRSMKCDSRAHSWPAPLQAFTLVASLRLGLRHVESILVLK
jgi:hypothetical protein